MIAEKFTIQTISNGFLVEGSPWRGSIYRETQDEALALLAKWLDEAQEREVHRLQALS